MTLGIAGVCLIGVVFNRILNFHTNVFIAKRYYWASTVTGDAAMDIVIGNIVWVNYLAYSV